MRWYFPLWPAVIVLRPMAAQVYHGLNGNSRFLNAHCLLQVRLSYMWFPDSPFTIVSSKASKLKARVRIPCVLSMYRVITIGLCCPYIEKAF
jgi:hypothetical protein